MIKAVSKVNAPELEIEIEIGKLRYAFENVRTTSTKTSRTAAL